LEVPIGGRKEVIVTLVVVSEAVLAGASSATNTVARFDLPMRRSMDI